ncbi:MAG: hypothetical protein DRH32_09880 [Deltaproteobacteria bacterium]|nr:MAG: hypothetical protein DRH32_09880 [Deltaproteobacteria bacterium]
MYRYKLEGFVMETDTINKDLVLSIMHRLEFFKNFSKEEKENLVGFYQNIEVYQPGETIIKEGDRDDASFFILLSGRASVTKGRQHKPIAALEPGEFFGEISFLTKTPRTATITADIELIVIRVNETIIDRLTPSVREKIKDNIIAKLAERLCHMNAMMEKMSF